MLTIRKYQPEDYALLAKWFEESDAVKPHQESIPERSSFMLCLNNTPCMFVSLILTNCDMAIVENFISAPEHRKQLAKMSATEMLLSSLESLASALNFKKLFCMSLDKTLSRRYRRLGFSHTGHLVETFVKGVIPCQQP